MTAAQDLKGCRVLVISASMGAGHHRAAQELERRLFAGGHEVRLVDILELPEHGQGRRLRRVYGTVLKLGPFLYDGWMRLWARYPRLIGALTASGSRPYERGLLRAVADFQPDVIVSTYNLASQAIARLKKSGRLDVPVATYVTDPGAHPYWIAPAIELHLAVTPATADALASIGAAHVVASGPLVGPEFFEDRDRSEARRRFGLPADAIVVLINAGSWGVGHVEHTAEVIAADPNFVPVTLCGYDDGLFRRLERRGLGRPLHWTDEVPELMAAADVLVDNAGGLTCLEALASGLPVMMFRPLPGHGRFNAATLERAGLASYVRSDDELIPAITALLTNDTRRARQVAAGRAIVTGDVAAEVLKLTLGRA